MTAQQALEAAFNGQTTSALFTYTLTYLGASAGYLVTTINGTTGSLNPFVTPIYFWQLSVNGAPNTAGVDTINLQPTDTLSFNLIMSTTPSRARALLTPKPVKPKAPKKGAGAKAKR